MPTVCWDKASWSNSQGLLPLAFGLERGLRSAPGSRERRSPAAGALAGAPAPPRGAERYRSPPAAPTLFSPAFAKGRGETPLLSQGRCRLFPNTNPEAPGEYRRLRGAVCLRPATAGESGVRAPARGQPRSRRRCPESRRRVRGRESRRGHGATSEGNA